MSSFWSAWIIVLTLGTLIGCWVLLRWCLTNFAGVPEGEPMDHEFDGIQELNNPLPKWWSTFFLVTIIWGFGYLALYPGLGNFQGLLGWKSSNQDVTSLEDSKMKNAAAKDAGLAVQYDREVASADERFGPIFAQFASQDIKALAENEEALKIGQRLFLQNCSQCHGSDAKGTTGFPNLTDNDWLYGGSPEDIEHALLYGRKAQGMIAWKTMLGGEQGVKEVAAYVMSLNPERADKVDAELASAGEEKFAMCAACHGAEGQGSDAMGLALGAPRLNDNIWLYGGSERAIEESIRNGRAGVMPAWKDILGEDKIRVISAYVYSLSQAE
ncbi:cytochrome-c oxidase, cbb3-type subunit III [Thalassotalea ponticola]|uniref:cytochrome-c oxidase, cbb3-type subunit III n=1 Tax=Thalassotalea ponticola TaxID=1523392 RepID=UPI0025B4E68A|nr:cytochrome-c oxidase, cbb3-type subunit III [Thalassotalea ponticola]MDN3651220.1 cytochrome-c oxidase, cbb3-type subunit III [Thalassotalea ponticola]